MHSARRSRPLLPPAARAVSRGSWRRRRAPGHEHGDVSGHAAARRRRAPGQDLLLHCRLVGMQVRYLGRQLAALEGAEAAYCTSSGMGAISAALFGLCDSGDHIIASNTVYGGSGRRRGGGGLRWAAAAAAGSLSRCACRPAPPPHPRPTLYWPQAARTRC